MSPSAFIPFCEFGGSMEIVGVKIDNFSVPVCNSFQAKVLNDQLCYEFDLNRFTNKVHNEKNLKLGFYFIMDYNEDRQITFHQLSNETHKFSMASSIKHSENEHNAYIYLNTIGK